MPPPYSLDLRVRVLADGDAGLPTQAVADKFRVSRSWVRRLKQRRAATGETAPRPPRNRRVSFRARYADRLRAAVAEKPDRTPAELRDHLGVRVSLGTLGPAPTGLKLSRENTRSGRPSRTART
jgi:transposase